MIPDRKPTDQTIVRPAGFAPNLSSMDVPRTGVAAKKRKRRIMIIVGVGIGFDSGHDCNFAFETSRAERRSVDRLGRHR